MKILLTMNLPYFPVHGGANKINRAVAEGLAQRGHTVEVVVPALGVPSRLTHAQFVEGLAAQGVEVTSDSGVDVFHLEGVRVHAVREPSQLRATLMERVARFEPDWILLSSEDPSHNLLDASLRARPGRVVYLVHTASFLPFGPQAFFPSRGRAKLVGQVAAIVSISEYVARYMRRWGGLESKVIYLDSYGPGPFPRLGRFDRGYVTMVNPCAVKGISIFAALARELPEVEFAAVVTWGAVEGDRRTLESLPNVTLLEPDADIERIFARTRVLLMPSLWGESFGLTAVEAMLRGIPVLASDVGGLPEAKLGTDFLLPVRPIVEFGESLDENMLPLPVVPEQDVGPWRDALRRLLSEAEFYECHADASREAALRFVSALSLDPLEELLTRPADEPAIDAGPRDHFAESAAATTDVMEGLDDLTPEQQSLLMLMLREKASKQTENQQPSQTSDIKPAPREGKLPLSFAQQRLWFLDQLEPGAATYSIPAAVRLKGSLDARALERAFNEVVRRHEVLRTSFAAADGQPVQEIAEAQTLELHVNDLRHLSESERETTVRESAAREARRPFNLSRGPLLRAELLRLSTDEHVLLLTMHHIVSDAWSVGVLVGELTAIYEAFESGAQSPLPELALQYADFAHWQRQWLQGAALEEQLSYWRAQLAGMPAVLELPTDRPRPPAQSYRGATTSFSLPQSSSEELQRLARREGVTLFMVLSAAFKALLSRHTGQRDISVGTPVANRTRSELESLVGFFVNTLVLRTDMSGDPTFRELVAREREVCLSAYAHQEVPFERVVEELQPEREMSHAPLFQVMFSLQNAPLAPVEMPGLSLAPVEIDTGTSMFDLSLSVEETARGLAGVFEYSTDLFDAATVERISAHLRNLLTGVAADAGKRLSGLPLMGEREARRLLVEWNETAEDLPLDKCLHEMFEAQAAATPDAVALIFEDERVTYGELNRRANRLARHLASLGVGPEVVVGICVERSVEMVAGLLGIMKAGGAYMPLEPEYPQERLSFMLEDAGAPVLLTERRHVGRLPQTAARVVCLDAEREAIARQADENLSSGVAPENLIYVIYTSGSTGEPKGAMLAHRGVCNCLLWMQQTHRLTTADRVLLKAPLSFDSSVWELFWPLLVGVCCVVARPGEQRDSAYLVELIARRGVTTVHFVPSMFQVFLEEKGLEACDSLRRVVCGGEALSPASVARFRERLGADLHNFYGPTETSIGSINGPCDVDAERRTVPIGRPISNTQAYILDWHMRPVPVGVHGELHTGGVGVARGYLNRPALTAERFIPDPFSGEAGARLYRTGDVARYLADGRIEFLGRADHQVKLRGLRIELGEIEAALESHQSVRDAAVVVREDVPGDRRLVAYVVAQQGATLSSSELRGFLKRTLPDFMLPSAYVSLDAMPLTHNVKIDRRRLPAPGDAHADAGRPYLAPRTPVEEIIASVWAGVLGRGRVGADDNFFDLGGHSLLATRVMSRLREAFNVELPLRSLFESPTPAELARAVERLGSEARAGTVPELAPVPRDAPVPLSFAQQRLWFLDQLVPGSAFYNIPLAVRLSGLLDEKALGRTLSEIVRRHETLRTTFPSIDGEPVQSIAPAHALGVPLVDLSSLAEAEREPEARRLASEEAREPFDLARGPLLRAKLLRLSTDEHVLLFTMHHIVSDAWSAGVLAGELTTIYEAFTESRPSPLPELPIQYADYAVWQRRWLRGAALEEQLSYWRGQLVGAPASLELPTDHPRPVLKSHEGRTENFTLPEGLAEELRRLSRDEGVTLFMVLSAAFKALLSRHTGQRDISVGTPVANRTRSELESLVGFFVNTLVLRTDMSGDPTFRELVAREREVCLSAYAHQEVPFERVVEELQPERDLSRPPLFQVMFSLQNEATVRRQETPRGLSMRPLAVEGGTAKFDLTMMVNETGSGRLACALEYDAGVFEEATAKRLAGHWTRLLEGVAADAGARLSELPLLTDEERRQLLSEWGGAGEGDDDEGAEAACVHELFERRAAEAPEAMAVVCGGEELSYGELNARANRLARHLRGLGVGHGSLVGVFVERSAEMIVALVGVLKAGGAYLPLDPSYPRERLSFMLKDAGVQVLLTQERLVERLPRGVESVVRLDADRQLIARERAENLDGARVDESVAYVIYTSGSTGQPKGNLITHHAITRLVCNPNYVTLDASDGVAQASNASFDAATFEVWGALLNGARLVILEREVILSPSEFASELRERGVTVLFLTTALFNLMAREAPWGFGCLRHLLFGGEAVDPARVREVVEVARPKRLLHVYGPTECTTFAAWHEVREVPSGAHTIAIGRPISKTQTLILDEKLRPVPVGVHGELHVGGRGLAHGYLNRPGLTAAAFIPHPFSIEPGARLYRTGDVARWRADGEMEFVGRLDQQIKLRGFRVELEEIEAVLAEHPRVRACVVTLREDTPGEKRLVAYVVAEGEATAAALREHLRRKLPEFMVPAAFMMLESLPLTPNGKIDRRALPTPEEDATHSGDSFVAPRDTVELQLARVWEEVLGVGRVGVRDNFFDLGGHSLLAVRLMSKVRKLFGRELPLAALFKAATVEDLAALIRREGAFSESPLVAIRPEGRNPPFFCVHPAGGNVICYAALARSLGETQPFYGLQARGLDGRAEPFTRLEEMAAHYVDALRGVRPEGPYLLGGWSLGGAVAFEMARQLSAGGQEVALLALLDSPAPPSDLRGVDVDEAELLAGLGQDLGLQISEEDLRGLEPDERLSLLLERGRARRAVPFDYDLTRARRLLHVYKTNVRALRDYQPMPSPTRITLLRADESAAGNSGREPHPFASDPTLGWGAISSAPVEVRRVPGDHVSMLSDAHVGALARELGRFIEEALAAGTGSAGAAAGAKIDIPTQG